MEKNPHIESARQILDHLGKLIEAERRRETVNVQCLYTQCEQLMKLASAELTLADVVVESAAKPKSAD